MSTNEIVIPIGALSLDATLAMPDHPVGLVVFVHGSGGGRCGARHQRVAELFGHLRIATLLVDLETPFERALEDVDTTLYDDTNVLAERLVAVLDSIVVHGIDGGLPVALFGSGEGAAAALIASARRPDLVTAIVSCGGRSDVPATTLERVRAATLFITGSDDIWGQRMNRAAARNLAALNHLIVIPGAGTDLAEPGAIEDVAILAARWFDETFRRGLPTTHAAAHLVQ